MPGTRGGGAEPGQGFTPSGLTRTLGAQYAAGGVVVLCWTALPWYAEASWRPVVALLGALSFVLGSVLLGLSRAALSRAQANLAANLAIASAELVVAVGWAATRDHRSPAIFFLLWTAAYAGLLSPRARWSHVAGTIALLVVAATTMPDPARALGDLIIFVSTVVVVTVAVSRIVSRLRTEATHDPLTGLANRRVFAARVTDRLRRREGEPLTVLLLDLDRFKDVNDTFGHATGDRLLVEVARRLERRLEPGELLARLGGDEFALVCWGSSAADPERVWQRARGADLLPMGAALAAPQ
ncbi:MAG TPA: GGDEF domain-containing protein [Actinotalea sp.]|nr:GGDEF domain-containing protein [Actinotalea sp.]